MVTHCSPPFFVSCFIAFLLFFSHPSEVRLLVAILVLLLGLMLGIVWATVASKKTGAPKFLARTRHTKESEEAE